MHFHNPLFQSQSNTAENSSDKLEEESEESEQPEQSCDLSCVFSPITYNKNAIDFLAKDFRIQRLCAVHRIVGSLKVIQDSSSESLMG